MTTAKLFFGGLDPRVTERVLMEIAQFAGPVQSVRLPPASVAFGGGSLGAAAAAAAGGNDGGDGDGDGDEAAAEGGRAEEDEEKRKAAPPPPPHAGFGFVVFEDRGAALYCLEMLRDSLFLFGRRVRVELSSG